MNTEQQFYDISPDDVHPDMIGDIPTSERTPVLHLDLDTDTVGQIVTVLQPMFESFSESETSTTIIAVYACEAESAVRWRHIWDYIKRNANDTFKFNSEIKFILIFVGDTISCSRITQDIRDNTLPENISIAIPSSIMEDLELCNFLKDFDLNKINIL